MSTPANSGDFARNSNTTIARGVPRLKGTFCIDELALPSLVTPITFANLLSNTIFGARGMSKASAGGMLFMLRLCMTYNVNVVIIAHHHEAARYRHRQGREI